MKHLSGGGRGRANRDGPRLARSSADTQQPSAGCCEAADAHGGGSERHAEDDGVADGSGPGCDAAELVGEIPARAGAPLAATCPTGGRHLFTGDGEGRSAVFSLAELDPAMTTNDIIVADTVDGQPLFDYQGPFRIVTPHDKRGARGVRMLQKLDVVRLRK